MHEVVTIALFVGNFVYLAFNRDGLLLASLQLIILVKWEK